jgi:hypothetical protein
VLPQILGHVSQILECPRKRAPVGGYDRIIRVHDIEVDSAVVCIHHYLDGVSDVIHLLSIALCIGAGIGEVIGNGVSILNPVQPAVAEYWVRILVQAEERRDG